MSDFIRIAWDLPWHIMVDILRRIPVASLARCSCVATSWRKATNEDFTLKRKIGLERAWLHEPINPNIIHRSQNGIPTCCCAKIENLIALGGRDGLKVFDLYQREIVFDCEDIGMVQSISFMDGILLTGGHYGDLCGWDISTWGKLFRISISVLEIWSIADLGDNVAVGGYGGHLQIWRKGVWELERSLEGHEGSVHCILPQPGNLLISGSQDETIRVWNLVDNACLRVIRGQKRGAFSMDVFDGLVFCGAFDGNIRSWEFESGEHVQTFRGHRGYVKSIVVKRGRMITASCDQTIKIWDTTKGACVRSFDCSHNLDKQVRQKVDLLWVDDETMVGVGALGEILEWDFSKGL